MGYGALFSLLDQPDYTNAIYDSAVVFIFEFVLLFLPAFCSACFIAYKVCTCITVICKFCWRQKRIHHTVNDEDGDEDERAPLLEQDEDNNDLLADRLLNPEDYEGDALAPCAPQPPPEN